MVYYIKQWGLEHICVLWENTQSGQSRAQRNLKTMVLWKSRKKWFYQNRLELSANVVFKTIMMKGFIKIAPLYLTR